MKFPRNAKLLRSPFDVAPFAAVFFLLILFLLLGALLPAPGLSLNLPSTGASNLPGTDKPTLAVAIDSSGRMFFASQMVTENELDSRLRHAAAASRTPLTLIIQADQSISYGQVVHVALIASGAGIYNTLLALQPRIVSAPNQP
ncbi:MAG TPA: biopolymer transporter ExbD [Candidatus Acidoferrum sp.]|jgi:biopolymer transport protein ExbD|nr:biopolymer transporter ExbD [Candidatus Acidoferrum sp.]